jgi:hypothetical protein
MLPALAVVADLEVRLGLDEGTLAGADLLRAQAALDDVSSEVRDEAKRTFLDDDGELAAVPDAVVRVVLAASKRIYLNPEAALSTTVGPFARQLSKDGVGAYLTDVEKAIVGRYRPVATGLWALRTTRGDEGDCTVWAYDQYGLEPFPIGTVGETW